jgi:hypothetical protein
MGMSASIDFQFDQTAKFNPLTLIDSLLAFGWSYGDQYISYLPLSDEEDSFDWQWEEISHWPKIREIITQQIVNKEKIGINLNWLTTLTGGSFLFETKDNHLLICLGARQRIKGSERATDFTWYLEKLLPPLEQEHIPQILEIHCDELRY